MIDTVAPILSSIPVPPTNVLKLGPLSFHIYGLCIAAGVLAGVSLARKRWADNGGDPDDITSVALIAVPAGLLGARVYHVITDFPDLYSDGRWWPNALFIWNGGLGIPGGVVGGVIGALLAARYKKMPWRQMGDATAPALPLAQAIGRFGNYFNQELFGGPTTLPWGLKLDAVHRPVEFPAETMFHPTFLYEALWNLALVTLIVVAGKKVTLKPGRWFAVYVAGYGLGRIWVESLRIDAANTILGLRVNTWTSLFAIIGGLIWLFWKGSPFTDDREANRIPVVGANTDVGTGADVVSGESALSEAEVDATDSIGEPGPDFDRPISEGSIGDSGTPEADPGVDP